MEHGGGGDTGNRHETGFRQVQFLLERTHTCLFRELASHKKVKEGAL